MELAETKFGFMTTGIPLNSIMEDSNGPGMVDVKTWWMVVETWTLWFRRYKSPIFFGDIFRSNVIIDLYRSSCTSICRSVYVVTLVNLGFLRFGYPDLLPFVGDVFDSIIRVHVVVLQRKEERIKLL